MTDARFTTWDGKRAKECDHTQCSNAPVLHVELTTPGVGYGAEIDLCEDHIEHLGVQARSFLVVLRVVEPRDEAERSLRATASEHV